MGSNKKVTMNHVSVGAIHGGVEITLGRRAAEAVRTLLDYIGGDPHGRRGLIDKIAIGLDELSTDYLKNSLISKLHYKKGYIGLYFKDKRRG